MSWSQYLYSLKYGKDLCFKHKAFLNRKAYTLISICLDCYAVTFQNTDNNHSKYWIESDWKKSFFIFTHMFLLYINIIFTPSKQTKERHGREIAFLKIRRQEMRNPKSSVKSCLH